MTDVHIGKRIKAWRVRLGLTQQALADRAEIDNTTISGMENEHHGCSEKVMLSITKALGISPAALYGDLPETGE